MDWFLEQARLGNMFRAANQAAQLVTLINTSTATGLILSNPYGSGKKLVIYDVGFQYTTVPAAAAILWWCQSIAVHTTAVIHTAALGVYRADGSGVAGNSKGKADSSSTTPNLPVYSRILGYSPTTPATAGALAFTDKVMGAMILVPGTFAQISYITTAPTGMASVTWVEVDE
ncbi:MAG: hypothetical protein E4H01_09140 [Lysobacterales bacterium]|nr:MAG: hypothetical protein E4H01_09140 [Xanthomonadales bacterium]